MSTPDPHIIVAAALLAPSVILGTWFVVAYVADRLHKPEPVKPWRETCEPVRTETKAEHAFALSVMEDLYHLPETTEVAR